MATLKEVKKLKPGDKISYLGDNEIETIETIIVDNDRVTINGYHWYVNDVTIKSIIKHTYPIILTPKENLELSIKALSACNVRPEIIKDMLKQLNYLENKKENPIGYHNSCD